ncbi:MAG: hydrolase, partial [Sphingopyxis sp.]|nr:hydrolase [Sphingopyxis sp.]
MSLFRFAAFRLIALSFFAAAAPAAAEPILYSGATVIDGTGAPARPAQDILVDGERIIATGAQGSLAAQAGNARKVDLSGRYLIPGLIDSHVHLATPPNRSRAEAILRRQLYGGGK